jgi:hypothetical protein
MVLALRKCSAWPAGSCNALMNRLDTLSVKVEQYIVQQLTVASLVKKYLCFEEAKALLLYSLNPVLIQLPALKKLKPY